MEVNLKKLEFMAAVKLVPPAVLEEINRRQKLCKAELGHWWEREHGKQDFCLVLRDNTSAMSTTSNTEAVLDRNQLFEPAIETVEIPSETVTTSLYTNLPTQSQDHTPHHNIFTTYH